MAVIPAIYADNDNKYLIRLRELRANGVKSPITTGETAAHLSLAKGGAIAHAALNAGVSHIGGGVWLVAFTGAQCDRARMDELFAALPPWLVLTRGSSIKASLPLSYVAEREIAITGSAF